MTQQQQRRQMLSVAEAAAYLGIAPMTLLQWRWPPRKAGPHWQIVRRPVCYHRHHVDRWLEVRWFDLREVRR